MEATTARTEELRDKRVSEEVKEEPFRIVVEDKEEFIPTQETVVTTSTEVCKKINQVFKEIYADYFGCVLNVLPNGGTSVTLFFDIPDDFQASRSNKPFAFESIDKNRGTGDLKERYSRITTSVAHPMKKIDMTKEGKEGLLKFLGLGNSRRDPSWDKRNRMITSGAGNYGRYSGKAFMSVEGIDPLEVMKELYGWKDDTSGQIWYQIQPIRPLTQTREASMGQVQNWLLHINRLFEAPLEAASEQLGLLSPGISGTGLPPMVRA